MHFIEVSKICQEPNCSLPRTRLVLLSETIFGTNSTFRSNFAQNIFAGNLFYIDFQIAFKFHRYNHDKSCPAQCILIRRINEYKFI